MCVLFFIKMKKETSKGKKMLAGCFEFAVHILCSHSCLIWPGSMNLFIAIKVASIDYSLIRFYSFIQFVYVYYCTLRIHKSMAFLSLHNVFIQSLNQWNNMQSPCQALHHFTVVLPNDSLKLLQRIQILDLLMHMNCQRRNIWNNRNKNKAYIKQWTVVKLF